MEKGTIVSLGDHFENFINEKVSSGKYNSVNDVIKTALQLLEQEEKIAQLKNQLEAGESSGMLHDFDPEQHLQKIHSRYL